MEIQENTRKTFSLNGSDSSKYPTVFAKLKDSDVTEVDLEVLTLHAVEVEIRTLVSVIKRFSSTLTEIRLHQIKFSIEDINVVVLTFEEWVEFTVREFRNSGRVHLPRLKVFEFTIIGNPNSGVNLAEDAERKLLSSFLFFDVIRPKTDLNNSDQLEYICKSGVELKFELENCHRRDWSIQIQIKQNEAQITSSLACTNIILQHYISSQLPLKHLSITELGCKTFNPELIPQDLEALSYHPSRYLATEEDTTCVSVLRNCPNTITELNIWTIDENVSISELPRNLKILSLSQGNFTYSSDVQFELDSLNLDCLEDLSFDMEIGNNFSTIFNSKVAYAHCSLFDFTYFLKMERIEKLIIGMGYSDDGFSAEQVDLLHEMGITDIPEDPYSGLDGLCLVKETSLDAESGRPKWKFLSSSC